MECVYEFLDDHVGPLMKKNQYYSLKMQSKKKQSYNTISTLIAVLLFGMIAGLCAFFMGSAKHPVIEFLHGKSLNVIPLSLALCVILTSILLRDPKKTSQTYKVIYAISVSHLLTVLIAGIMF